MILQARKSPKQRRAIDRIETIINAAKDVIRKDGYSEFSTNKVAKAANVNIASVYQYFPNKESLILFIHEQHLKTISAHCQDIELADISDLNLEINDLYRRIFPDRESCVLLNAIDCAIYSTPVLHHLENDISNLITDFIVSRLKYHGSIWEPAKKQDLGRQLHHFYCSYYYRDPQSTSSESNPVFLQNCQLLLQQALAPHHATPLQQLSSYASSSAG